jgi:flagellar basal body-associated protein FliL
MAENEEVVGSEEVEKKGGLPLVPIIIGVVLLVVIGAVVWFVVMPMLSPPVDAEAVVEEPVEEVVVTDTMYDFENPAGILEFAEAFTLKLKKREGAMEPDTYLRVNLTMEVDSIEIQDKMLGDKVVMSKLRDVLTQYFSDKFLYDVDVSKWPLLKEEIMIEVNKFFPSEYQVRQVYILDMIPQQ